MTMRLPFPLGCGHIPGLLDLTLLDEVMCVSEPEAIAMAARLGAEEGLPSASPSPACVPL